MTPEQMHLCKQLWPDRSVKKIYGPYPMEKETGRTGLIFHFEDDTKTSMTTARWMMTCHLGRILSEDEHVDHVDDNPTNDSIENLQILTPGDNIRKAQLGRTSPMKGVEKGWTHGSIYAWMKKKCECEVCYSSKRRWHEKRNADRESVQDGPRGPRGTYKMPAVCGSVRSYYRGCRCDKCKAANAKRSRMRSKGLPLPPTDEVIIS